MSDRSEYFRKYCKSKRGKEVRRSNQYKYCYGITTKDYDFIYNRQKGCCAICGVHQSKLSRRLSVDHDHKTKKVRGLLCYRCNSNLGWYELFEHKTNSYLK